MHMETALNTESAEHQKVKHWGQGAGGDVKFSSPFGFSQGDGVAHCSASPMQQGMPLMGGGAPGPAGPASAFGLPPPGAYYQAGGMPPFAPGYGGMPGPMAYAMPQQFPQYAAGPPGPQCLEGWLSKRGHDFAQGWLQRWFMLRPGPTLTYSRNEGGKDDRQIAINASTQVRAFGHPQATGQAKVMKAKRPFGFEIYLGPDTRTWYLDAGSADKLEAWLRNLNEALAQLRWQGPGMPGVSAPGMPYR